jgi:hypothetical protein
MPVEVEDAKGQQRSDYAGDAQRRPEEAESDWQFAAGVEVGEPEDKIGNETALEELEGL